MPEHEILRLQAIQRFLNLEINKDQELQEIVELTSELLNCPVSLITLIKGEMQYFLYKVGTHLEQESVKNSFCRLLKPGSLLIIPDTSLDSVHSNNPYVKGPPFIRFYAGMALHTHDGHQLGSFCVMDTQPRQLTEAEQKFLKLSAKQIIQLNEFEFNIHVLKEQVIRSRDAEIKLRAFFETSNALHLLVGKDLKIIDFNRNFEKFIKQMYTVSLKSGLSVRDILQEPALESFINDFNVAITGKVVHFERKVKYANDEEIWWDVTYGPGFNTEGEIIGISYNVIDITERKNNETLIMEQNKTLKEVAYMQSHGLRKPVASILGLMEVIKIDQKMTEELTMLEQLTINLDTIIKDIVIKVS